MTSVFTAVQQFCNLHIMFAHFVLSDSVTLFYTGIISICVSFLKSFTKLKSLLLASNEFLLLCTFSRLETEYESKSWAHKVEGRLNWRGFIQSNIHHRKYKYDWQGNMFRNRREILPHLSWDSDGNWLYLDWQVGLKCRFCQGGLRLCKYGVCYCWAGLCNFVEVPLKRARVEI